MKCLMIIFLALFLFGCASTSRQMVETNLVGVWEGAWDEEWENRFEISHVKDKVYQVKYYWVETLGQPMKHREIVGYLSKDHQININNIIIITLDQNNPNKAVAIGNFSEKRKAFLNRAK